MARYPRRELTERENPRDLRPLARRLLPFLTRYKWQAAAGLFALAVASAATLTVPVAVRRVLDNGFNSQDPNVVNTYFIAMLGVVLVLAIASATRFYFVSWIGERVVNDVRDHLFRHLTTLTPDFYEQQRTGEVVSRLTADRNPSSLPFPPQHQSHCATLSCSSVLWSMMIYTSPRMSGLAALAIPLVVVPLIVYGRSVRNLSRAAQDALAQSAAFAQERLSAITTVQSNTQEQHTVVERLRQIPHYAFQASSQSATRRAPFSPP